MNFKKHRLLPRLLCNRPALIWIVGINIAAFLCLRIIAVVLNLSGNIHLQQPMLEWVALPATLERLASRPWTVLTYMFCQYEAQHLILNMLILYWAGSLYAGMAKTEADEPRRKAPSVESPGDTAYCAIYVNAPAKPPSIYRVTRCFPPRIPAYRLPAQ